MGRAAPGAHGHSLPSTQLKTTERAQQVSPRPFSPVLSTLWASRRNALMGAQGAACSSGKLLLTSGLLAQPLSLLTWGLWDDPPAPGVPMSPNVPLFTGVKDERAAISLPPAGAAPLALHFDVLEPCLPGPGWDPSPMFPIRNLINPL